jgi:hypothetical protein
MKPKAGNNAPSRTAEPEERGLFTKEELAKGYKLWTFSCARCGGNGMYSSYHGVCFECSGSGQVMGRLYTPEKREALDVAADRRREQKAAKREADRVDAYKACIVQYPETYERMALIVDEVTVDRDAAEARWGGFLVDIALKCYNGGISSRQRDAFDRAFEGKLKFEAKKQEDAATASPVIEGSKMTITGEVLVVKLQSSQYGETLKMLVRDERGFKVWGSVPRAICGEVDKGSKVQFRAGTVEKSSDDPTFGFFKRPDQAKVVES